MRSLAKQAFGGFCRAGSGREREENDDVRADGTPAPMTRCSFSRPGHAPATRSCRYVVKDSSQLPRLLI